MEKLLVFDIDFRTILQGFLSCKRRHFGGAFTSKLTHVPRERIAQTHRKNGMKMKIFVTRMHHHASTFLTNKSDNFGIKMSIDAEVDFI